MKHILIIALVFSLGACSAFKTSGGNVEIDPVKLQNVIDGHAAGIQALAESVVKLKKEFEAYKETVKANK